MTNWKICLEQDGGTSEFGLVEGVVLSVGRSSRCDIRISSPKASRNQFTVELNDGTPRLRLDPDSSARTKIDGQILRTDESVWLRDGTVLEVPGAVLRVMGPFADEGPADSLAAPGHPADLSTSSEATVAEGAEWTETGLPETGTPGGMENEPLTPKEADEPASQTVRGESGTSVFDSPETDATEAGSETMPTSGGIPPETSFDEEDAKTSFLSEDDARDVLRRHAARRRNKVLWTLLLVVAGIGILLWSSRGGSVSPWKDHEGTFFSLRMPCHWASVSKEEVIHFQPSGGYASGVALFREEAERIWLFDYERALEEGMDAIAGALPVLEKVEWDSWGSEEGLPDFQMPDASGIPYVARRGRLESGGAIFARIYLSRNQFVLGVVWSAEGRPGRDSVQVLDSLMLNEERIRPDSVFRDLQWREAGVRSDKMVGLIEEAGYLFEQRLVAKSNAWRAYGKCLEALRVLASGTESEGLPSAASVWQSHLLIFARYIDEEFSRRRVDIIAAEAAGDSRRARLLAKEIQELIPDRADPRWLWAQRIAAESGSPGSGRGFFE